MAEPKKLFLLDAMALIYRAYFALNKNPRINSKGLNTSAILGFANTLYEVLKNEKPTHIGIAIDTKAPTVRHEDFSAYKANREAMPEDISLAIPYILKLIEAFNIPLLSLEGYEADDIIGTLSKKAEKKGFTTYMMTPDKDFGQLVSDHIYMYKPARMGNKPEILGVPEICEKYGIKRPEQFIDILGLWGDVSDNIPGVPGIGEKTASKLISEFENIENLLKNTDQLKGKQKENVEKYSEQALMSKQLATIILDVPIEFDEDKLVTEEPNLEALKALFEELEFRQFAKRFFTDQSLQQPTEKIQNTTSQPDLFSELPEEENIISNKNDISTVSHTYILVDTETERHKLIKKLSDKPLFCFDTETTDKDPNKAELVGLSFAYRPGEAFYVPLPDNYNDCVKVLSAFKPLFENEKIEKTGQNIKFDMSMLKWYDIEVKGPLFDTMIAHYLLEPDLRHGMDYLADTYLNYKTISYDEITDKRRGHQLNMREVQKHKISQLVEYACEDADITLQLAEIFKPKLGDSGVSELYKNIESPLIPVLVSMETEGVKLDIETLKTYSDELHQEILRIRDTIYEHAGQEFNIASPKQLGEILFDRLKIIDNPKKTKTKQYSTGEDILQKLVKKHPIISEILDFRSLSKLKSTYVDTLPAMVNPRDGRIHTSYMQTVASTGRLSSQNPNLQNIPIRTEKGREIRKAFIPRDNDHILFAADYSQIELRIIAELSKDPEMIADFKAGIDIHTATASKVYGVALDQVSKDMRRNAKMVNFGIVYGISAFGLSERLGIQRKEAAEIINQYFKLYKGIKDYMEATISIAREKGYVETIMGRRRYLTDINSANAMVRGFAERNAINAPIQGSSADMIKIAMIRIHDEFQKQQLKSKMILQVHDELVFDTLKDELPLVQTIVEHNMKSAIKMEVPIVVDMNTGNNWLEAH